MADAAALRGIRWGCVAYETLPCSIKVSASDHSMRPAVAALTVGADLTWETLMLVFFARQPRPDARYWAGREILAGLDAVVWPIAWIVVIQSVEVPVGVMGPFFTAVCVLAALTRVRRALWENHRYWFTTWKWGRYVFAIWIAGMALKLAVSA